MDKLLEEIMKHIDWDWSIVDKKRCVNEIERLQKEKEWLIEKYTKYLSETSQADTELAKKHILKSMQQALKEE